MAFCLATQRLTAKRKVRNRTFAPLMQDLWSQHCSAQLITLLDLPEMQTHNQSSEGTQELLSTRYITLTMCLVVFAILQGMLFDRC